MSLSKYPKLTRFFSTVLVDADAEADIATTEKFVAGASDDDRTKIQADLRGLLTQAELPLDEFGAEANRWFGSSEEAKSWLESLLVVFDRAVDAGDSVQVVDSNGATLLEGDSVTVIKDLPVKGGNSDLKRGTLIKKIHLTSDPGLIECKVDGSVLVLKTIFLKKS